MLPWKNMFPAAKSILLWSFKTTRAGVCCLDHPVMHLFCTESLFHTPSRMNLPRLEEWLPIINEHQKRTRSYLLKAAGRWKILPCIVALGIFWVSYLREFCISKRKGLVWCEFTLSEALNKELYLMGQKLGSYRTCFNDNKMCGNDSTYCHKCCTLKEKLWTLKPLLRWGTMLCGYFKQIQKTSTEFYGLKEPH